MGTDTWTTVMVGEMHTYRRDNLVVWFDEKARKWMFNCMACNVCDDSRDSGQRARAAAMLHRMYMCGQGRNF